MRSIEKTIVSFIFPMAGVEEEEEEFGGIKKSGFLFFCSANTCQADEQKQLDVKRIR